MSGGARAGAGRKPSPPLLKKEPISVKLPKWLIDWTREQPESRAVLIEDALKRRHKLKPPEGHNDLVQVSGAPTINEGDGGCSASPATEG